MLQASPCAGEEQGIAKAAVLADAFNVTGAAAQLDGPPWSHCSRSAVVAVYLHGLMAARQAYARGGDQASLRPVREAIARLDSASKAGSRPAELASLVLQAAASAAQSEREEMAVFLEHALRIESSQLEAGLSSAPIVTAHEAAGDLWLQVHQYARARDAYQSAVKRLGAKPRLTLGLARVAVRLKQTGTACAEYRSLLERWHWAPEGPAEIDEARTFAQERCRSRRAGERRP